MYRRIIVVLGIVVFALLAAATFAPQANASPPAQMGNFPSLYYNYIDGGGTNCPPGNAVFSGYDNEIFKYWPEGTSPVPGIVNTNNYMVCWNGSVYFPQAGTYTVYVLTDDGMNVWVNGAIAMNAWYDQGPTWHQGDFYIPAPGNYSFEVKYYNRPNAGVACVSWALKSQPYTWKCPFPPGPPTPPICPGCPPVCPGCPCQGCPPPPPPPPPCQPWPQCSYPPPPPPPPPPCQPWPQCNYPPPPPPQKCFYRVQYGDNLSAIAWKFHVAVWQLVQWNHLSNPNYIYAGMVLKVCPF
ncbi:MAG TPA: LysM peptidoglycan-binding domain-containing protein [Anaerolineae bacterium]|nr:LysM peptidoglycan-binding domain-containing protein [Anaerolineae bacterium]